MPDQNSNISEQPTVPVACEMAIVKWFSPAKGYGFVLVADPKNNALSDLFLHIHAVKTARVLIDSQQTLLIERGQTADGRPCVGKIHKVLSEGPILRK